MMGKATHGVRIFLGLFLLANGLNFWFGFLPLSVPPNDLANQLMAALVASDLFEVVKTVEITTGLLLLCNRFVPLSLLVMTPLSVIIFWLDFVIIGTVETWIYGILLLAPQAWLMLHCLHSYLPLLRPVNALRFPARHDLAGLISEK
ncbi:MAG: hypothetical protein KA482_09660 [Sphingobium sp.]|nr:hypothetical protein [Sphingobium sp.]MBP8671877.1 hypothetical protein [Sphingobium sp.]MBP9158877.1 hypothetical protein [Sphingobium sp.]MCC6482162.1 hypothetical protein [Sphingomonadaceae bacterium]